MFRRTALQITKPPAQHPQATTDNRIFPQVLKNLKGKGIKNVNGKGTGDLYFTVVVDVPKRLNSEQRDILKKFAEVSGENFETGKRRKFF